MQKAIGVLFFVAVFVGCLGASIDKTQAAQPLNRVEIMVLGAQPGTRPVPMGVYSGDQVSRLVRQPGLSVLSMPSVTAANGVPAQIGVLREARFPGIAHPRKMGMNVHVQVESSRQVSVQFTSVRFQGFSAPRHGDPILNTQRLSTSYAAPEEKNFWQVFILPAPARRIAYDTLGKLQKPDEYPQLLLIRVTPVKACPPSA